MVKLGKTSANIRPTFRRNCATILMNFGKFQQNGVNCLAKQLTILSEQSGKAQNCADHVDLQNRTQMRVCFQNVDTAPEWALQNFIHLHSHPWILMYKHIPKSSVAGLSMYEVAAPCEAINESRRPAEAFLLVDVVVVVGVASVVGVAGVVGVLG